MEINMSLHLNDKYFLLIKNGTKTMEMRLNDEKRQKLKVGDIIEFTNRTDEEKLYTKIIGLYHFPSFKELYENFPKESLGYAKEEEANPNDMKEFYSEEEQKKYGVVAIEIEKV